MDTSFERMKDGKDEWLTPPEIVKALGEFDLDPCAPIDPPWVLAKMSYTINDDGLSQDWHGRVFCNPPYGTETGKWLEKLAEHGNGIGLTFARTETKMFHRTVWEKADAVFFFEGRLSFYHVSGEKGGTAGSPSCLIAYGTDNAFALMNCGLKGKFIPLKHSYEH